MNFPDIGELNRLVSIKKKQEMPAMNPGIDTSYTQVGDAWAKVEPVGTGIYFGSKQIESGVTHRISLRYTDELNDRTITGEHVVIDGYRTYRVRRASDLNGAGRFVMLDCEDLGSA